MVQSQYVIFITRKETCPSIILNILKIPQAEDAKYLGLHLGRLNGKECVLTKWKQLGFQLGEVYCSILIGNK